MERELPAICSSNYACTTMGDVGLFPERSFTNFDYTYRPINPSQADENIKQFARARLLAQDIQQSPQTKPTEKKMADKSARRIVRVIIIDPDEALPLEKCILYSGEEKFTDLTNEELFFEVDMKPMLDKHNAQRVIVIDKKLTQKLGKEMFLEPTRIKELRMTVVEIASF